MTRDLVRDYDADGVERKPRYTVAELEAQLHTANTHLLTAIQQRDEATANYIRSDESAYQLSATVAELEAQLRTANEELQDSNGTIGRLTIGFTDRINELTDTVAQQAATIGELLDEVAMDRHLNPNVRRRP